VNDDEDDVQWQTDTSLEAARLRIQEQLSAATADMVMLSTDEPEKKLKPSTKATDSPKETNAKIGNNTSSHEALVEEIKANMKKSMSANQLQSLLGSLSGSARDKMTALFEALFGGVEKGLSKEVVKKKNYLAAAVVQDEGSQILLLQAIESFCGKLSSSVLKEVALVLKALYDADILEEEYIVQWYEAGLKGTNKDSQIWKTAKPFIEWLQSAESESEEE
jgi:translation initiation factor 5